MSLSKSGKAVFDAAVAASESTLQGAVSVASTQATANAAAVVFYRAALASAITNRLDQGVFIQALQQLRVTP
jgi:hypothetical protein